MGQKLKNMEYTCRYAYSRANLFMQKYGVVSGIEELMWRYNLREEEVEFICDKLIGKGKLSKCQKDYIMEDFRKN